ncbi:hypothetical protein FRC07_014149 [Ceratobasidium sp. 392]|nr:hypothetical protein FRC07_014149 [Ceratobasidium sp. 392]
MAPINNASAIFNEVPHATLEADKEYITTRIDQIDLEAVKLNGGILIKTLYLSVEPYLRSMMRSLSAGLNMPVYKIGEPIFGFGVATVLRSEKSDINIGDNLYVTLCPFQQYAVLLADHPIRVIPKDHKVPLSAYLGFLGMPGMTAFYGLELIGKPKKGETLYVSSGAGSVGSLVAQLAKLRGLNVIASASTNEKVEFMKSIGVDVPFNYKTENIKEVLAKEGPIDLYWDNVGGSTLEGSNTFNLQAALDACNLHARVVVCGAISGYNSTTEPYGVKTLSNILFKRLRVQGYVVTEGESEYEGQTGNPVKFLAALMPLIRSGELKWSEQVLGGVEHVGKALLDILEGRNTAKVVIKVNDP